MSALNHEMMTLDVEPQADLIEQLRQTL